MNFKDWIKDNCAIFLVIGFFIFTALYLNYISGHIESKMEQIAGLFMIQSGIIVDCSEVSESQ